MSHYLKNLVLFIFLKKTNFKCYLQHFFFLQPLHFIKNIIYVYIYKFFFFYNFFLPSYIQFFFFKKSKSRFKFKKKNLKVLNIKTKKKSKLLLLKKKKLILSKKHKWLNWKIAKSFINIFKSKNKRLRYKTNSYFLSFNNLFFKKKKKYNFFFNPHREQHSLLQLFFLFKQFKAAAITIFFIYVTFKKNKIIQIKKKRLVQKKKVFKLLNFFKIKYLLFKCFQKTNFLQKIKTSNIFNILTLNYNFTSKNLVLNKTFLNFFLKFLKNFFEIFFKKNVCLNFLSNKNFFKKPKHISTKWYNKYKNFTNKFGAFFNLKEFFTVFLYFLVYKDQYLLVNFLKRNIEKMTTKLHKKFFQFFKKFVTRDVFIFFKNCNFIGLRLEVSGKISVAGNAKTRKYTISAGAFSLTKKCIKLKYLTTQIRTITGVLGMSLFLSYK